MTEQHLNGAQVGAGFQQMGGETVSQGVRVDATVLKSGAFGGVLTGVPENLGGDRDDSPCASGCRETATRSGLRRSPRQ